MKTATLTETKNNLSALIDKVRHGETIVVLDRGRPVARIESAVSESASAEDRLSRLERQGVVRRGSAVAAGEILSQAPPKPKAGASALEALLEERESGR
jgi:prevent-host-death family protein